MSVVGPAASPGPLAQSRFPEDVFEGDHQAVFGSYFDVARGLWGYACCRRTGRGTTCGCQAATTLALDDGTVAYKEGFLADAAGLCQNSDASSSEMEASDDEDVAPVVDNDTEEASARAAAAALRAAKVKSEIDRILGVPAGRHVQVLGLIGGLSGASIDGHLVRQAYRKIALLVHPDKNPGFESRCKEALVRVQEAREALEMASGSKAVRERSKRARSDGPTAQRAATKTSGQDSSGSAPKQRKRTMSRNGTANKVPADLTDHAEARTRDEFTSPEEFVCHVLTHCLYVWQQSGLDVGGTADGHVQNSQVVFQETAAAVLALRKILEDGALGTDPLRRLEQMCIHLLAREYVPANQAYLGLAIGNRTWHSDVPSLIESGCNWGGRKAGVERGRLFKQARVAQRLNDERRASATLLDDEDVKGYVTSMKRLLTVAQMLRPHEDPSRNCL